MARKNPVFNILVDQFVKCISKDNSYTCTIHDKDNKLQDIGTVSTLRVKARAVFKAGDNGSLIIKAKGDQPFDCTVKERGTKLECL